MIEQPRIRDDPAGSRVGERRDTADREPRCGLRLDGCRPTCDSRAECGAQALLVDAVRSRAEDHDGLIVGDEDERLHDLRDGAADLPRGVTSGTGRLREALRLDAAAPFGGVRPDTRDVGVLGQRTKRASLAAMRCGSIDTRTRAIRCHASTASSRWSSVAPAGA